MEYFEWLILIVATMLACVGLWYSQRTYTRADQRLQDALKFYGDSVKLNQKCDQLLADARRIMSVGHETSCEIGGKRRRDGSGGGTGNRGTSRQPKRK